jgi:hypothetical protein
VGLQEGSVADLLAMKIFLDQIKMFCFHSDIKRTKSKRLLRFVSFWIKRSTLPMTISRPIQIALLRSTNFGAKRKRFASYNNWDQIKIFAFVQIVSGPNQNIFLSFRTFDMVDIAIREPNFITINVPLFKKLQDIIFFCGTITFLTP